MSPASPLLASIGLVAVAALANACGSSAAPASGASSSAGSSAGGAGGGAPSELVVGGDRPATLYVPPSYAKGTPAPLLVMLHGYGVSGVVEDIYLGLRAVAAAKGFLYVHPDGTVDEKGSRFWNATDGCCDMYGKGIDDSSYLAGLVAEIEKAVDVDRKRVYFIGHSNGGFMSYRMACDHADIVAAIGSLAGAMWLDTSKCRPSAPVSVLEVHGTADTEVAYGGALDGGVLEKYPGAETSVEDWVTLDGCAATPATPPPLDLESSLPGAETTVERWAKGCKPGGGVELWTIHGGTHIPNFGPAYLEDLTSFLLAHPKP
jgi:polyhydroxybutyrate depolymerase